jgi:hypothetical protein
LPCFSPLEALIEERRGCVGNPDDFVGCLPIEFEIEFSPGLPIIPIGEMFELSASHWPLRQCSSSDSHAHARRLARYAAFLPNGVGVSDDTASDESLAALILAREYENRVAFSNQLAAYIVFWAVKVNVLARGSTTSAFIAYAMNVLDLRRNRNLTKEHERPLSGSAVQTWLLYEGRLSARTHWGIKPGPRYTSPV